MGWMDEHMARIGPLLESMPPWKRQILGSASTANPEPAGEHGPKPSGELSATSAIDSTPDQLGMSIEYGYLVLTTLPRPQKFATGEWSKS